MSKDYSPAECVSRMLRTLSSMKIKTSVLSDQIKFILEYAIDSNVVLSYYSRSHELVKPFIHEHYALIKKVFPDPTTGEVVYQLIDPYIQNEYSPLTDIDEDVKEVLDKWDEHLSIEEYKEEITTKQQAELLIFGCLSYIHDIQQSVKTTTLEVSTLICSILNEFISRKLVNKEHINVIKEQIAYIQKI